MVLELAEEIETDAARIARLSQAFLQAKSERDRLLGAMGLVQEQLRISAPTADTLQQCVEALSWVRASLAQARRELRAQVEARPSDSRRANEPQNALGSVPIQPLSAGKPTRDPGQAPAANASEEARLTTDFQERDDRTDAVPNTRPTPTVARAKPHGVLVLDGGQIGQRLTLRLRQHARAVMDVTLDPATNLPLVDDLLQQPPRVVTANLALADTWKTLRRMCETADQRRVRFLAYAASAEATTGVWLGKMDLVFLPLPEGGLARFLKLDGQSMRVMVVSSDLDLADRLRTQLESVHISTAVALDERQTLALLPVVRPQALVVDFRAGASERLRMIGTLRQRSLAAGVPIFLLMQSEAWPSEEDLARAGAHLLTEHGTPSAGELVDKLVSATALDLAEGGDVS